MREEKNYEQVVKEVHELAKANGNAMAMLLLNIINEIYLDKDDAEKTFEDNDASECFVHDEMLHFNEILEDKLKTLEERIKKLEGYRSGIK